jgi:hypothetical protein
MNLIIHTTSLLRGELTIHRKRALNMAIMPLQSLMIITYPMMAKIPEEAIKVVRVLALKMR